MSKEPIPVLRYQSPYDRRRANWPGYVVAISVGMPFGYFLSEAGYGVACVGIVGGFFLGLFSALAAGSRKIVIGLLGNVVAMVTCIVTVAIHDRHSLYHFPWNELPAMVLIIGAMVVLPGLFGSVIVWGFEKTWD